MEMHRTGFETNFRIFNETKVIYLGFYAKKIFLTISITQNKCSFIVAFMIDINVRMVMN